MDNQTEAELNQYFNNDHRSTDRAHPEDSQSHSGDEGRDDKDVHKHDHEGDNDDEDSDFADEMPVRTATTSRTNGRAYTIPTRREYANTGVKGVIADAQAFEAARRRQQGYGKKSAPAVASTRTINTSQDHRSEPRRSSRSETEMDESTLYEDEDDDEFTRRWRQQRMQELQDRAASVRGQQRQQQYGAFTKLSADGYLDVVEKSSAETFVVVLLWDYSEASEAWEDELKQLAYRHGRVRFIGLRWDVAEIQYLDVPSILVYKGGDVFVTIDSIQFDEIGRKLKQVGVLPAT